MTDQTILADEIEASTGLIKMVTEGTVQLGIKKTAMVVAALRALARAPETWRCFHCDEVFTDEAAAREHFGISEMEIPGCKLNALEGGLLGIVRRQEEQLEQYHREDTASYREFYSLGADHYRALRSEEEKGYARGLKDAREEDARNAARNPPLEQGRDQVPGTLRYYAKQPYADASNETVRVKAVLLSTAAQEIDDVKAENVRLRAALARSKDPCVYCSLPAEELLKCNSGFPGCSRADDVMSCPELGATLRAEEAETKLKKANPAIKALREWFGFQSADNANALYNAAGKLFGSTFDPTEYDAVE